MLTIDEILKEYRRVNTDSTTIRASEMYFVEKYLRGAPSPALPHKQWQIETKDWYEKNPITSFLSYDKYLKYDKTFLLYLDK